ncbi:MAG: cell envelope integrity protein CreD [Kiritimatiellae bacterium]|nr:cell envelope integrity protein CreD [Kiritimatiellia bacterium]
MNNKINEVGEKMNSNVMPPPLPGSQMVRKNGTVIKMVTILIMVILLMIPLLMINSVLSERLQRRNEAVSGITATWGSEQTISGPVLIVPYKYQCKVLKDQVINGRKEKVEVVEQMIARAYFLPANLKVSGKLDPSILHRGIYEMVVYRGSLLLSGSFDKPVFDEWKVKQEDIMWEDATVSFMITDLRGAKEALVLKWGEKSIPLAIGSKFNEFPSGLHVRLGSIPFDVASKSFEMSVALNGSKSISFAPVGAQTEVKLSSAWPDPSFQGSFLPVERKISAEGFEATWQISCYGRSYPQQWSTENGAVPLNATAIQTSHFGVSLVPVVDSYRYVERSIKYGALFIVLAFTVFFLFEILSQLKIHPFQYTLVGVALSMLYLAELSLSAFIDFSIAYMTGAILATVLITFYSGYVLKSFRRALIMAGGLSAIYGFLYVILRQQDYSLLFGTGGLFIVLVIVMYVTRHIDWYARDEK